MHGMYVERSLIVWCLGLGILKSFFKFPRSDLSHKGHMISCNFSIYFFKLYDSPADHAPPFRPPRAAPCCHCARPLPPCPRLTPSMRPWPPACATPAASASRVCRPCGLKCPARTALRT